MPDITAEQMDAITAVTELDSCVWYDIAERLTCREAEAVAAFLDAWGGDGAGLLECHAEGDDEGDAHYPKQDDRPLRERILAHAVADWTPYSDFEWALRADTPAARNELSLELHELVKEGVLTLEYGRGFARFPQ